MAVQALQSPSMELAGISIEDGSATHVQQSPVKKLPKTTARKLGGKIPTLFARVTDSRRGTGTLPLHRVPDKPAATVRNASPLSGVVLLPYSSVNVPTSNERPVSRDHTDVNNTEIEQEGTIVQAAQSGSQTTESKSALPVDPAIGGSRTLETNRGLAMPAERDVRVRPASTGVTLHSSHSLHAVEERLYDYEKRAEVAEARIWNWLQHHMRGFERVRAAISVDRKLGGDRILILVTCSGRAITKRREIESILNHRSMRSELREFNVEVIEAPDGAGFWFTGPSKMSMSDVSMVANGSGDINVTQVYAGQDSVHFQWVTDQSAQIPFAVSPYWTTNAALIEYVFKRHPRPYESPSNPFCGTRIRTQVKSGDSPPVEIFWTYGGPIYVDGQLHGLTTAHPLVYAHMPAAGGGKGSKAKEEMDRFSTQTVLDEVWKPLGLISRYALADVGTIPAGNDWLLIDLMKSKILPTMLCPYSGTAVQTHRGILPGVLLPTTSFIILGTSPFEATKMHLQESLEPGDSGALVVQHHQLFGIVIASGKEPSGLPFAYVLKAEDVCKSVSEGMNGAEVRFPTNCENAIQIHKSIYPDGAFITLAALYIDSLIKDTSVCSRIDIGPPKVRTALGYGDPVVDALTMLGAGHANASIRVAGALTMLQHSSSRFPRPLLSPKWLATSSSTRKQLATSKRGMEGVFVVIKLLSQFAAADTVQILLDVFTELQLQVVPTWKTLSRIVHNLAPPAPQKSNLRQKTRLPTTGFVSKALARLVYAAHMSAFYVYRGPWAKWLHDFATVELRYHGIYLDLRADVDRRQEVGLNLEAMPFIFAQQEILPGPREPRLKGLSADPYGSVVDCQELTSVMLRIRDDPERMLASEEELAVISPPIELAENHPERPVPTRAALIYWAMGMNVRRTDATGLHKDREFNEKKDSYGVV